MTRHTLDQALIAYRAGRFDEAAAQCRAALALAPRDEALAALLAMADHAAGRHDAAAESFEALTRWRPDAAEYWSNLGYMRRLAGRYGEAEAAFHRSLALDPRSYGTLLNLGLLLLDMGRFGAARHALLDAVALDPDAPMARIYGSCACFECGDARLAAELIPPPDTWTGLDAELRRDLAMALIHVGRTGEA
jgi:tetratricopeptide (TPR) repeat protein